MLAGAALAGVAGALTGCSGGGAAPAAAEGAGLRRRAARASAELLAWYDETARAHPGLENVLAPFREAAAAHVAALRDPGGDAAPAGPVPGVPREPGEALGALAQAEQRLADDRFQELVTAPPDTARILASLAAAGSAQAYLLSEASA